MPGVTTVNVPSVSFADEVLVNSGGSTRKITIQRLVALLLSLAGPAYSTRAQLYADLDWPAGSVGRVHADPTPGNNGTYRKDGPSGSGAWTWIGELPSGAIETALIDALATDLADLESVVEGKADLASAGKIFATRAEAEAMGQAALPAALSRIITIEGDAWALRSPDASTDDPLFGTAPRWGVIQRMDANAALQFAGLVTLVGIGGTANAITASLPARVIAAGVGVTNLTACVVIPTATNTGPVTLAVGDDGVRRVLDNDGAELPPGYVQQNRILIVRRLLDGAAGHFRVLNDASERRMVDRMRAEVTPVAAAAALADERAQVAAAGNTLATAQISALAARLSVLENAQQDQQMTTYNVSAAVGTSAAVVIAAGPIQSVKIQNLSDTERVYFAFGTAPTATAGLNYLEPGGALAPDTVPAGPLYMMTASGTVQISGFFSVPLNAPNPNWEPDFQTLVGRMVTAGAPTPSLGWQDAYRDLYSALRREGTLGRARGLYVAAAHAPDAARVNWAAPNALSVAAGAPGFTAKVGWTYDGSSYHTTGLSLATLGVTTLSVSALLWPGPQVRGTPTKAQVGDGVFALHANRSAVEGGVRAWSPDVHVDAIATPGILDFMGVSRFSAAQYVVHLPGGSGEVRDRARINTYPTRAVLIGAQNSVDGPIDRDVGTVRATLFGLGLTSVQILAAQTAMTRFFRRIEAL